MEWIAPSLVLIGVVAIWGIVSRMQNELARTERKVNLLLKHFNLDSTYGYGPPLSERVKELARDPRRKIEAIKVYREETGVGLAEAKDAVESYINSL
jgi:ribosomal protein L7/L12